ncbi:hypothetical protein [Diaphorobacter caeni]|uniref:hypothetical protein n=1 Tax=Diaphorobacter caeni TaxID=2784387 RepID=UPI00188F4B93|nr:hypothetical protein [Diaphorobacter caeni]MBF5006040.1 hypothetical protein [Diaphorobacter caeni]
MTARYLRIPSRSNVTCMRRDDHAVGKGVAGQWGKAQQRFTQAAPELAERRGDEEAASQAWKQAAIAVL